jgi:hypothetical protein
MTRSTNQLSASEADLLRKLREAGPSGLPMLRGRVAALREAGWTLAAVGEPLNANRSTTKMWQLSAKPEDVTAARELAPIETAPKREQPFKVVRLYPDVPAHDLPELHRLADSARRVRGWASEDSPQRQDAKEFEKKLQVYVERGVPIKRIADHLGVTHRAIAARLERSAARAKAS